jgi:hypothetical protein
VRNFFGTLKGVPLLIYGVTALSTSFLLFIVEPLIAKRLLPFFGGGPHVWTTCLFFFQLTLLAGYWYAHLVSVILPPFAGGALHLILLLVAGIFTGSIPLSYQIAVESSEPTLQLFTLLICTIGLPFFVLASSAPLLQRWYKGRSSQEPYVLYAMSNIGSAAAVALYPFVVEPYFPLSLQQEYWNVAVVALFFLLAFLQLADYRKSRLVTEEDTQTSLSRDLPRFQWFLCSAVPSSLLLGITHYLTANIAPVPLFWMVPLILYLLTFVVTFSWPDRINGKIIWRVYLIFMLPTCLGIVLEVGTPFILFISLHCLTFTLGALGSHARRCLWCFFKLDNCSCSFF